MKTEIKNPAKTSGNKKPFLIGKVFSSVFLAGFLLFAMPALASISYTRTPAGDNPSYPVSFNLTDVASDYCSDYDYYGIYISSGMTERLSEPFIATSTVSGNFNYFGIFGDTATTSTLPVGFVSSQVALACSDYEYPTESQYNNPSHQLETYFTITEPLVIAIWVPANFVADVGSYVNDFINDISPAIILVIGLALATLVINWLIGLFIKTKKK